MHFRAIQTARRVLNLTSNLTAKRLQIRPNSVSIINRAELALDGIGKFVNWREMPSVINRTQIYKLQVNKSKQKATQDRFNISSNSARLLRAKHKAETAPNLTELHPKNAP